MLTERQLMIFQLIIDEFVKFARPIGSRILSENEKVSVSPATIRNVMADLEKMGFIKKTHSSSGRVPSQKGYRFYVDHLIEPLSIDGSQVNVISHLIEDGFYEFEKIVELSAEMLSDLTKCTTLILGPEIIDTRLKQIDIVKLSRQRAIAILVTDTGHVEHRTFIIPEEINSSDIEMLVNILNDRLEGVPIVQLSDMLDEEVFSLIHRNYHMFEQTLSHLKDVLVAQESTKLYVGGKSNILTQPEFNDIEKIHSFYTLMEEEQKIINLLKESKGHLKVTIGKENKVDEIKDFTLITSPYKLGEDQLGTIAILGPTRMEYRKVITLLKALSNEMSDAFYTWYK